jgi:hypothetical protein
VASDNAEDSVLANEDCITTTNQSEDLPQQVDHTENLPSLQDCELRSSPDSSGVGICWEFIPLGDDTQFNMNKVQLQTTYPFCHTHTIATDEPIQQQDRSTSTLAFQYGTLPESPDSTSCPSFTFLGSPAPSSQSLVEIQDSPPTPSLSSSSRTNQTAPETSSEVETKVKKHRCPTCHKLYPTITNLNRHCKTMHDPTAQRYKCQNRGCKYSNRRKDHVYAHQTERCKMRAGI